ncbi:MAG: LacI family DNA-binding transcriptional regulator, partial [Abditibacteriaceae bacterium]
MLEGTSKDKKVIRKHHATLSDVAMMAGVSPATASLALNGKPVAEETRRLVKSVSEKLGFEPNPLAKRLSNGLNNSVVSLLSLVVDAITWHSMSFLHYALSARGYEAPLYTNGETLFGYPQHAPLWNASPKFSAGVAAGDSLLSNVCRQLPQALIINADFTHNASKGLVQYQQQGGIVLCVNQPLSLECDQILFDRASNTRLAAEYLLKAGHTKIGLCSYLKDKNAAGRVLGFVNTLRDADVSVNHDWLFESGYNEEGGARLAEEFLALRDRP